MKSVALLAEPIDRDAARRPARIRIAHPAHLACLLLAGRGTRHAAPEPGPRLDLTGPGSADPAVHFGELVAQLLPRDEVEPAVGSWTAPDRALRLDRPVRAERRRREPESCRRSSPPTRSGPRSRRRHPPPCAARPRAWRGRCPCAGAVGATVTPLTAHIGMPRPPGNVISVTQELTVPTGCGPIERPRVIDADEPPECEPVPCAAELLLRSAHRRGIRASRPADTGRRPPRRPCRGRGIRGRSHERRRGSGVGGGVLPVGRKHATTLSTAADSAGSHSASAAAAASSDAARSAATSPSRVRRSSRSSAVSAPSTGTPQLSSCAVTPRAAAGPSASLRRTAPPRRSGAPVGAARRSRPCVRVATHPRAAATSA